jgi:hypothetical protein
VKTSKTLFTDKLLLLRRLPQAGRHRLGGEFEVKSLDPALLFRLLVLALRPVQLLPGHG